MFGISGEHILILGIILLFFGPRRLPELGNTLGKALRNFKDAISGVQEAQFHKIDEEAAAKAKAAAEAKPEMPAGFVDPHASESKDPKSQA